jgi:uncharacterized protein YebE (UPF0316 family)
MYEIFTSALLIFAMRLAGISLDTMRMLMVMRGKKPLAWIFGLLQGLIFVIAIGWVLADIGNWMKILGYSMGFATGLVVGMTIENRIGIGYTNLRIISPRRGIELAERLRELGYAVTEVSAQGLEGAVSIIHCSVQRKYERQVIREISELDPEAFVTTENVFLVQHGYWNS